MGNQAEIVWLFNMAPTYKYGFELPYNYLHVLGRDVLNKNSKWQNSDDTKPKSEVEHPTKGHHKKIRVHLVDDGESDITTAFMTMPSVRIVLCQIHRDSATLIRLCIEEAEDYSDFSDILEYYKWPGPVYGELSEVLLPTNAPQPHGDYGMVTHYVATHLMHDILTGRSVTGILHSANKTPMDWLIKKQVTFETSTDGSEFVAVPARAEQVVDPSNTLRHVGVPFRDKPSMVNDIGLVVNSSSKHVHAEHRTMLSFHQVREVIASKFLVSYQPSRWNNPPDVHTKHLGFSGGSDQLKSLNLWKNDTGYIKENGRRTPPSTERGVTDSTQDWIGYVSAPLMTWQYRKDRSIDNLNPKVSVSVVTWQSWKKRQSRGIWYLILER